MDQSTAVCVIGPGRAGTSVTMRVLNLLGVEVGHEEGLVEAGPGAPKGFWERRDMIRLNDRLLRSRGGSWRGPPRLPLGWETAEDLTDERRQASALLESTFSGRDLWGWKDPRVSLTTAFWLRLVPQLRFVICLRSPVDVADSISPSAGGTGDDFYYSRRGPKWEQALWLWLTYVASSLANSAGRPRLLVSYDDYFEDRRETVERLARFVGREPPPAGGETERRIEEFVEGRLRHHHTSAPAVMRDARVPREVASLYLVTELLRAARAVPPDARLEALEEGVDVYAQRLLAAHEGDSQRGVAATPAISD
jgi:hypothetical protein